MPDVSEDVNVIFEQPIEINLSNGLRLIHQKEDICLLLEVLLQFDGVFNDPKDKLGWLQLLPL